MKKLRKMKVINWHYFDEDEISFGSATMLSGHSGAGKSTLLDALQYIFIGSQTQTRFNAAATQEARRTLLHYLRGKIKAEDVQYLRANEFTSYIVLEFYDDVKKISFLAGYVVDVFRDDELQEEFFLLDRCTLAEVEFRSADGALYTREAFRRRYAHAGSVFETGKKQWQKRLMNRLGQLSARFLPAFSRALAFRPIDHVRDFIYEYILLPRDLKLDVLREVFYSYQKFERDLQGMRAQKTQLEILQDNYIAYCKWRDTVCEQEFVLLSFRCMRDEEKLETGRRQQQKCRERLDELRIRLREQERLSERRNLEWQEAYAAWQGHEGKRRRDTLLEAQRECAEKERALIASRQRMQKALLQESEGLAALSAYRAGEFFALPVGMEEVLRELAGTLTYAAGDSVSTEELGVLQERMRAGGMSLAEIGAVLQRGALLLEQEQTAAARRQEELQAEIEGLKRRQRKYRPEMTRLRALLQERLAGRSKVHVLCEELEILDEEWRDTIEGYLNTQRFDLLVEQDVFREALHIYETEKRERHLDGVGLVNTEAEKKYLDARESGSLASLLQAKNPLVQARINHLLGTVMQAADEQEMLSYKSAATKSCMSYKGLVARQIPRRFYEIPYIGAGAIERQLAIRQRELEEVRQRLSALVEEAQRMQEIAGILNEPLHRYADLAEKLSVLSDIEACAAELKRIADELAAMDFSEIDRLKQAYEEAGRRADEAARACRATTKEQAHAEAALDQAERALPLMERAADEAAEAVRAWQETYPELAEGARTRLDALLQEAHDARGIEERLQNYEISKRGNETRRDNMWQQLLIEREYYGIEHGDTGHVYDADHAYYEQILERLAATDIPSFEEKAREALAQSEMEFKAHFIFSMREAIENARYEFRELNHSLDQFQFHKDKYSFIITPSAKYKPFYDAVMAADWETAGGLFAETDTAANEQAMELFDKLVKGTPEEQEEFSDYRRYLDYDIRITDTAGQSYMYSRVLKQTSGGETQTPFYIAILAAFQQIYNDKTIRLTVFDEAFNKMDEERIKSCIRLIQRMGMQLVVAVPDEKLAAIAPLMDQSIIVTNAGNHCFTDELGNVATWEKGMKDVPSGAQETLRAGNSDDPAGKI